jgi:hypothetical protein
MHFRDVVLHEHFSQLGQIESVCHGVASTASKDFLITDPVAQRRLGANAENSRESLCTMLTLVNEEAASPATATSALTWCPARLTLLGL